MATNQPLRLCLTGAATHAAPVAACAHGAGRHVIVCLATNLGAAETLAEETGHLLRILGAAEPTARAVSEADAAVDDFEAECDLLGVLAELRHGAHDSARPLLIACAPSALLRAAPAPTELAARELRVTAGDTVDLRALANRLATMGYAAEGGG
ncbi:MAG: hypothetical protein ACO23N_06325, partial [Opitutales bacterium]